jgi:signal transduction histidine kinase
MRANLAKDVLKKSDLQNYLNSNFKALEVLLRNIQRSADLVSRFKEIAIIQHGETRSNFDLNDAVSNAIQLNSYTKEKIELSIEKNIQPGLNINSFHCPLRTVLLNLINNCVIHGFDGRSMGHIRINAFALSAEMLELSVWDNGNGIEIDNITRIFDPFFTTKLGIGGTGLGLSIVYNIVTSMLGGSIEVTSEVGKGTTFTLTLPMVAPEKITKFNP